MGKTTLQTNERDIYNNFNNKDELKKKKDLENYAEDNVETVEELYGCTYHDQVCF